MTVVQLDATRREHTFAVVAETVVALGGAVGMPDREGWPTVLASIRPVRPCAVCDCAMPAGHMHKEVTTR